MSNATETATNLTSYCRNRKHGKCSGVGCECKCHGTVAAVENVVDQPAEALPGYETEAQEDAAIAAVGGIDPELPEEGTAPTFVQPDPESTETVEQVLAEIVAATDEAELEAVRTAVQADTGCGGCDNGEDCGLGCTDAAVAAARQLVIDRLTNAPAAAPAKPKKVRAPKAPKEPKPVVKGTVDGKLSNAHKRAIRVQMVAYLAAMPVELTGDLEGVTAEEAAAYVDTYWVKYIDPARDKARHAK